VGDAAEPDDFPPPAPLGPHPDGGDLVLSTRCFVDRDHKKGRRHAATLHEDWTITVPHDLEAERVVVALGGYLSCLDLVDRVAPAVEVYLRRNLRADPPQILRTPTMQWQCAVRVKECCPVSRSWPTPQEAAGHWRSSHHVAAELDAPAALLAGFGRDVLRARGVREPVPTPPARHLVGRQVASRKELHELWEAGLSPELVEALHLSVEADGPLPLAFYLGAVTKRPNLGWLRDTHHHIPERADLAWLTWTETPADRQDRTLRRSWLRLGVPKKDIARLTSSPYGPDDVRRLAEILGRSGNTAASILTSCIRAKVHPNVVELGETIALSDANPDVLSLSALNRLEASIELPVTREQAALALITCASAAIALDVIRATGSVDPAELRRGLDAWEQQRKQRTYRA
jgi:hypothetical protein